jgi:putative transposase
MPRIVLAGQAHHIIQRGNNRQAIFFTDEDRRVFLDKLGEALGKEGCALHAYVLMTNHIHLLITPETDDGIGRLLQSVGRGYVGYVNRTYRRSGTLFEGRFKSTIVDAEGYVLACYRYIEANPVRAKMVGRAGDYPWSSHGRNAEGRPDALVQEHAVYRGLGSSAEARLQAYRELFQERLSKALLAELRDATQRGWVPGGDRFRKDIEAALGRRLSPPVRGRPRKGAAELGYGLGR